MKKKNLKSLTLNKTQVSNLVALRGGQVRTHTMNNCGTDDVGTSNYTYCLECEPITVETVCETKSNTPTKCWYSSGDTF